MLQVSNTKFNGPGVFTVNFELLTLNTFYIIPWWQDVNLTYIKLSGKLLNILCTFNLRPTSRGVILYLCSCIWLMESIIFLLIINLFRPKSKNSFLVGKYMFQVNKRNTRTMVCLQFQGFRIRIFLWFSKIKKVEGY